MGTQPTPHGYHNWLDPERPSEAPREVLEWEPMAPSSGDRSTATTSRSRTTTAKTTIASSRQMRPPRTSGPVLTPRDLDVLRWVGRHGIVTREHVANRFFGRDSASTGIWAAYRRVRILVNLGLLQQDHCLWREPAVLRLTSHGARIAQLDVRPARLVLPEVRHALAVVDLVERLLAQLPDDTLLITEREMRVARRRDLRLDPTTIGTGRMPDAELRRDGQRVAIELDLTPKRSAVYEDILNSYMRQRYDAVWWYVSPRVVDRLKRIVVSNQANDFVSIEAWEG